MSYDVTVLAVVGDSKADRRVLCTTTRPTLREATGWISRNRETFRGALQEHESHFEAWVENADGERVLYVRHPREGWGDDGDTLTRSQLREMAPSKSKPSLGSRPHHNGNTDRNLNGKAATT